MSETSTKKKKNSIKTSKETIGKAFEFMSTAKTMAENCCWNATKTSRLGITLLP